MRPWPHGTDADNRLVAVDKKVHEEAGLLQRIRAVCIDGAIDITIGGTQCIVGESSHVHHQGIVRASRAIGLCGPVRDCQLCMIEQVWVASNNLLAGKLKLAILRVIQSAIDRASSNSTTGV